MRRLPALVLLLLLVGCAGDPATVAQPSSSAAARPSYTPKPPQKGPHFDSPEAAMRYLAVAWNNHDLVSLKHVTDPAARELLEDMRSEAVNLKLAFCNYVSSDADYRCHFTHDYPKGYRGEREGNGTAVFRVGPADRPGWYMTYFESCG